jgi:hypothetical protein
MQRSSDERRGNIHLDQRQESAAVVPAQQDFDGLSLHSR